MFHYYLKTVELIVSEYIIPLSCYSCSMMLMGRTQHVVIKLVIRLNPFESEMWSISDLVDGLMYGLHELGHLIFS